MKRRNRRILNQKGLTLVEVMVAISILLMAAEIISLSVSFTARMNTRSRQLMNANEALGMKLLDDLEGEEGSMEMQIASALVKNDTDGKLYSETAGSDENGVKANAIWAKDAVMTDLYAASGITAETIGNKPEWNTLPDEFNIRDDQMKFVESYYTVLDDGSIVFNNGTDSYGTEPYGINSYATLDGLEFSVSGTYTASGVAVLQVSNPGFYAEHTNVTLQAEIYNLSGEIECQYSEKYKGKSVPIHLYLEPYSGHGQPALVYVEEGTKFIYHYRSEDGLEVTEDAGKSYSIPKGWYAIPPSYGESEEAVSGNARDLLKMTEKDWEEFSLETIGNTKGALDKAYARLVLAGLISNKNEADGTN